MPEPSTSVTLPWTYGNRLQLLNSGQDFFPALIAAMAEARQDIFLETYIFAPDAAGEAVLAALCEAARRGVKVHLVTDGFGARHFPEQSGQRLRAAGVRFQVYRPEHSPWQLRRNRLRRLHRKLAVIDRRVAFVGGINIIDDRNTPAGLAPRVDFTVRAEGPVAQSVFHACLRLWTTLARSGFQAHVRHWSQPWLHEYRTAIPQPDVLAPDTPQAARFLPRDNLRFRQCIADAYLQAIQQAEHEILLAHAYFLPAFRLRHALREAARRGVRVTILLQGSSDHRLLQYATRALYGLLLAEGIRLHEYTRSFLHAKVGVVDGQWATVGSSNMDPFSLELAQEGNLEIRDATFAGELRSSVLKLVDEGSTAITQDSLHHAGWLSRLNRWLAYGLVRLLISLAGYGKARGMR